MVSFTHVYACVEYYCRQLFAEKKEKFALNDNSIYSVIIVH